MTCPVVLAPGLIFDARTVIVAMAGVFGGLPAAVVAALMAGAYRLLLGGVGVWMGLATIATPPPWGSPCITCTAPADCASTP